MRRRVHHRHRHHRRAGELRGSRRGVERRDVARRRSATSCTAAATTTTTPPAGLRRADGWDVRIGAVLDQAASSRRRRRRTPRARTPSCRRGTRDRSSRCRSCCRRSTTAACRASRSTLRLRVEQRLHQLEVGRLLVLDRLRLRVARLRRPLRVDRRVERRHARRCWRCSDSRRAATSSIATSNWPLIVAMSSGVVWSTRLVSLMSAPPSSSARAASTLPCRAA